MKVSITDEYRFSVSDESREPHMHSMHVQLLSGTIIRNNVTRLLSGALSVQIRWYFCFSPAVPLNETRISQRGWIPYSFNGRYNSEPLYSARKKICNRFASWTTPIPILCIFSCFTIFTDWTCCESRAFVEEMYECLYLLQNTNDSP